MSFPLREPPHIGRPDAPYLPGCSSINLSNRGRHSREYLDAHKNVEKRRRDRINNCLETIRQCVPACRKVPLTRRLEKGEILDMTISYLQLVNHFLAGIGIHDVYSASKQEIHLYTGIDNWIRENHGNYTSVSEFAQHLHRLLQNETEIFSAQITMEHSWLSRKSAAFGDMYTEGDGYTQMTAYQSETDYEDEKPSVPSNDYHDTSPPSTSLSKLVPKSPAKPVLIKQECCLRESSAESPTKKLKLVENSTTVIKSLDSLESKSYRFADLASPAKKPKLVEHPIPKLVANPGDRSLDSGEGTACQGGSIAVLQSRKETSCHQRDSNLKTNGDSLPFLPSSDGQSTCSHSQRPSEAGESAPSSHTHHNSTSSHPQRPPIATESAPSSQFHRNRTCCHLQRPAVASESPPNSQSQHQSIFSHPQKTPVASETAPTSQSHHCSTSSHPQRPPVAGEAPPSSCMPCNSQCHSLGDVRVSTSMGCVTIPIRLGSIQIAAPKEMLQPLQEACISPIVFNAQIESSDCPTVGENCLCMSQTCQQQQRPGGLSIDMTESKERDKT